MQQRLRHRHAAVRQHADRRSVDHAGDALQRARDVIGNPRRQPAMQLRRQCLGLAAVGVEDIEFGDAQFRKRERDRLADAAGTDQATAPQPDFEPPTRSPIARAKPVLSVLCPTSRPSRTTTVLTAPMMRASGDISSSSGITASL